MLTALQLHAKGWRQGRKIKRNPSEKLWLLTKGSTAGLQALRGGLQDRKSFPREQEKKAGQESKENTQMTQKTRSWM